MPVDIGGGVMADTVGDLLGSSDFIEVETALEMPRLETTDPEPPVGIHFNLPDEAYHRIAAFSKSHLINWLCSPTQWWEDSWLNPNRKERDVEHFIVGRAYHAMILEGHDAYTARFYPMPDPRDYPKALRLADEIKQAITDRDHKPWTRVDIPGQEGKTKAATKSDHIAQLAIIDRSVEVWDLIVAQAERAAAGRQLISADNDRRIRLAARMIMQDPNLAKIFKGGYPEVTLIWRDPRTGVLCKCRPDYLKSKAVIDLKSFANSRDRSIRNAIIHAIAANHYAFQPPIYLEGIDEVRKLVREHGADAIFHHGDVADDAKIAAYDFACKWASNTIPDRFLWFFQSKSEASVTRALWHPIGGTTYSIAQSEWRDGLRSFRRLAEVYGSEVYLDLAEIDDLGDEEIPPWALII